MDFLGAIADLILAVAFLLGVGVLGFLAIFRPNRSLRVRHGDSELALGGEIESDGTLEIGQPAEASPSERPPEDDEEKVGEAPDEMEKPRVARALDLFRSKDFEAGLELVREEAASKECSSERNKILAFGLYLAASNGSETHFRKLGELAEVHPDNPEVRLWLGLTLYKFERFEEAVAEFQQARISAEKEDGLATATIWMSRALHQADKTDQAVSELCGTVGQLEEDRPRAKVFTRLGELLLGEGSLVYGFAAYEEALALLPTDADLRFKVAYAYNGNGASGLALYHYRKLLELEPQNTVGANNTGVAAAALDLDVLSIRYYRRAEEGGNTLATANLAQKLIDAGFLTEAREALEDVVGQPDVHDNVLQALGSLPETERREEERLREVEEGAGGRRNDLRDVAKALVDSVEWTGTYVDGERELVIKRTEDGQLTGRIVGGAERDRSFTGSATGGAAQIKWQTEKKADDGPAWPLLSRTAGHGSLLLDPSGRLHGTLRMGTHELEVWRDAMSEEFVLQKKKH